MLAELLQALGLTPNRAHKYLCPLHPDKNPSLAITPDGEHFHCFGCGAHGSAYDLLMQLRNLTFPEAKAEVHRLLGLPLPEPPSPEARARQQALAPLREAMQRTTQLCQQLLSLPSGAAAGAVSQYAFTRFGDPHDPQSTSAQWALGYCPPNLLEVATQCGTATQAQLTELGLLAEGNLGPYTPFADRLIIPIRDAQGYIVSWAGRLVESPNTHPLSQQAKYINTKNTPLFTKRAVLFGLHAARGLAAKTRELYLVEGYADCMRLHALGAFNTVARMGTARTREQIGLLAPIAERVYIIPDTDTPGLKAARTSALALLEAGIVPTILSIPPAPDGAKQDADSYLHTPEDLQHLRQHHQADFLLEEATSLLEADPTDPVACTRAIGATTALLAKLPPALHPFYLDRLGALRRPKSIWVSALNDALSAGQPPQGNQPGQNPEIAAMQQRYGFYFTGHTTIARREAHKGGPQWVRIANFELTPLYYIASPSGAKRILKLENETRQVAYIEIRTASCALRTPIDFRAHIAQYGNYSFSGDSAQFTALLEYINQQCEAATEIETLGYQPQGYWAFANGIHAAGAFTPYNDMGIATLGTQRLYYAPANRATQSLTEPDHLAASFLYRPGALPAADYFRLFTQVYGPNGQIALIYLLATLFRDHILAAIRIFPLLNPCGVKGSGKSMLAQSLSALFFERPLPMNIPTSTIASLSTILGSYRNALVSLDEYSNQIGLARIELLKSLYDGGGRTKTIEPVPGGPRRMHVGHVEASVCLSGQQVPEADPALYSRVISLPFMQTTFTPRQKEQLEQLHATETQGLSHILAEVASHRAAFTQTFATHYQWAIGYLQQRFGDHVEARTIQTWSVLVGTYRALAPLLPLPFTWEDLEAAITTPMRTQIDESNTISEVAGFWEVFTFLCAQGIIREEFDYRIELREWISVDANPRLTLPFPTRILFINYKTIAPLYQRYAKDALSSTLPRTTLKRYLIASPAYLGTGHRIRLRQRDQRGEQLRIPKNPQGADHPYAYEDAYTTCRAMCFIYADTGLHVDLTTDPNPDPEPAVQDPAPF